MLSSLFAAVVLTAAPDVKFTVVSTPPGAELRLDEAVVGVTPVQLVWPAGPKHTLTLSLAGGWSTEKRVVKKVKEGEELSFVLIDLDLKRAQKNFDAAQARHDKDNATLERLQEQQADNPSDALAAKVAAAELAMQSAVEALDHAEEDLARVKKARSIRPGDRCKSVAKKYPDGGCP